MFRSLEGKEKERKKRKKRKVLTVHDDMKADMEANTKLRPMFIELLLRRRRNLNISLACDILFSSA